MHLHLALLSVLIPSITALGINCRGSSTCGVCRLNTLSSMYLELQANSQNAGNNFYPTGAQIYCEGNCCAFYQSGANGTLSDAVHNVKALVDHGCKACGSDPTNPGNDVSTGQLTVNYVHTSACCPEEDRLC